MVKINAENTVNVQKLCKFEISKRTFTFKMDLTKIKPSSVVFKFN